MIDSPTPEGFLHDARDTVGVETSPTVNVYEAMLPRRGLACGPVSVGAMWPSAANA